MGRGERESIGPRLVATGMDGWLTAWR
uniref:Uncharacterized protein n=1 Tax=Arundo donax TaxID=35708 RepID=A0A0A9AFR1_ARUDO